MTIKRLQPAPEELRLERSGDSLTDWKSESRINRSRSLSEESFEEESHKCLVSDSNFHSYYSSLFFSRRGCITRDNTIVMMQLSWKSMLRGSSFSALHAPTMSCASRSVACLVLRAVHGSLYVLSCATMCCVCALSNYVLCFAQRAAVSLDT